MSDFAATVSQHEAIFSRGNSVLVSAGAGSGKTRVITERLMSYITDRENPVGIDRFVVITYTRASAAELRSRITEKLRDASAKDPENRFLRKQIALARTAQIGTIHHFCSDILKEYGHYSGLSANFSIINDERAEILKARALNKVMESWYDEISAHPGFEQLLNTAGLGRDDSSLQNLVRQLHEKMQCHSRPELWAAKKVDELSDGGVSDIGLTVWGRELLNYAAGIADYWIRELDSLMKMLETKPDIAEKYMDALADVSDIVRGVSRRIDTGWDAVVSCPKMEFGRLRSLKDPSDPVAAELVKMRKKECKAAMENLMKMFRLSSAELLEEMRASAPAMKALLDLTMDFSAVYSSEKRKSSLLDYSDLEHMAAGILIDADGARTETAREIASKYTEIMVDEYQDVSRVQDEIFRAVSDEGRNLFMVGDIKQSIYRFRLAEPAIFSSIFDRLKEGENGRLILLRENFRSRSEILNAANRVFDTCMTRQLGDIDYNEDQRLIFGAKTYEGNVPVPEITVCTKPESPEDAPAADKTAAEAAIVAKKIIELIESKFPVTDGNGTRPICFGDIAVLMRNTKNNSRIFSRELSARGIPVADSQSSGFFRTPEILAIYSLLKLMDNPHNDVALIAALRSAVFGFSPDKLSQIRSCDKKHDMFTALKKFSETDVNCRQFVEFLNEMRTYAEAAPEDKVIWRILDRTDAIAVCSAMPDGNTRTANLMQLVQLASDFRNSGYHGLHRFVMYLDKLAEKESEIHVFGSTVSAVRIMSVHRSKGLEFPVVFLCCTGQKFNISDSRDTVLVHPELGLGPKFVDLERHIQYPTLARSAIAKRIKSETLSEEMRLLYVAMTRAKERLFITGTLRDPIKELEKARGALMISGEKPSPELLSSSDCSVKWLIYAAAFDNGENFKLEISGSDIQESEDQGSDGISAAVPDMEAYRIIENNLEYSYPYIDAQLLPSKVTATELKFPGQDQDEAETQLLLPMRRGKLRSPDLDLTRTKLTAAEKGTATHLALQYMDFGRVADRSMIVSEIDRLRKDGFLSAAQAEAVDTDAIYELFRSETGKKILSAENVRREFRFSIICSASEIFAFEGEEEVLLQGVVDCCIEENGCLVIIDYKTDKVRTDSEIRERTEYYSGQIRAYAYALSRIFGMSVKECVLYYLSAGKEISVDPCNMKKSLQ